jgi:hypothetical protein
MQETQGRAPQQWNEVSFLYLQIGGDEGLQLRISTYKRLSTDRIGSYKSNNHTITATTVPSCIFRLHVHVPNRTSVHAHNNQHSLLIVFDVVRARKLEIAQKTECAIKNIQCIDTDTRQNTKTNITKTQHKLFKKWVARTTSKTINTECWLLGACTIVLFGTWTCNLKMQEGTVVAVIVM